MAITNQQFFYDKNVRSWMYQIIRLFSGFTVQYGLDSNNNQLYSRVPAVWGDSTFSAATIARLNSENVMATFPMISIYISNLRFDRPNTYTPTFEDNLTVRIRQWDANVGAYLPTQANAYNVKRFMPVPYKLEIKVDIVTSNTQQKLQILEQLLPLFNPALEIQKNDNYLDWESLGYLELDDVIWSNRTIPVGQGSDSSYDVCTLAFHAPIWMSLPAQVSKMGVIFKVIMDIQGMDAMNDILFSTRQVVTYNNYGLMVNSNNQIQIFQQANSAIRVSPDAPNAFINAVAQLTSSNLGNVSTTPYFYGGPLNWTGVLDAYGNIRAGVSMIGLTYDHFANEILGTISVNPLNSTLLSFNPNVSTLPANTLSSINMIVNPQFMAPNIGLPPAAVGQSYLLTANIGTGFANTNGVYIGESATKTSNTVYTLSNSNIDPLTTTVSMNGLQLVPYKDYILNQSNINLTFTPNANSVVYAYYVYNTSTPNIGLQIETPGGLINSSNQTFTLTKTPNPLESLTLFYNGSLLDFGVDYTITNNVISLTFVPTINSNLLAIYRTSNTSQLGYAFLDAYIPQGIINGTNTTFSLPSTPSVLNLFLNGQELYQNIDYTLSGSNIIYNTAPPIGASHVAYYAYPNVGSWPYNSVNSNVSAYKNDIITYNGNSWVTTFSASQNIGNIQFVYDTNTNLQYQWNGNTWILGWYGPYDAASWRLIV